MRRILKARASLVKVDALESAYKDHNRLQATVRVPIGPFKEAFHPRHRLETHPTPRQHPNEVSNNNPCSSLDPAHEGDPAVAQHPTREHGFIEARHVANADAPPHSPPPLTTEIEPDQRQGSSHHPHT
jgi:hypothetical protein